MTDDDPSNIYFAFWPSYCNNPALSLPLKSVHVKMQTLSIYYIDPKSQQEVIHSEIL